MGKHWQDLSSDTVCLLWAVLLFIWELWAVN